ncbi:Copper binding protein [Marine Group I thaumarchaeote SCGC AAA799-E16]|uniref:Copper binding protein n=1 Tax=Marine Group I thaumarchaeote SCGC AAA799-E16 TaxID=1502292 RepID=A0A081S4V7_9ARCH|nr:Copper binding protein [Marine Group I thaumarchaeote SCGC AAA799-E16]
MVFPCIKINIESSSGVDTTISFFGRLVAESKDAAVYGFTGRITTPDNTYKIIYTTKLSTLSKIDTMLTTEEPKDLTIRILKGASLQGGAETYIGLSTSGSDSTRLGYFSKDRISIEPGTSITIVNNDLVSHSILSGKENYGDRHDPFNPDGRISTGDITPGDSTNITFDEAGFYRLYDPNYPWMKIVAYVFPSSDSLVLGQGQNLGN